MKLLQAQCVIEADLESLIKKIVKTIQKNLQQEKQVSILLGDTQCQQYEHSIAQNISIVCIVEKIV